MMRLALLAALTVGMAVPAAAHHIWIEPDASGTPQLHFGEFAENLREVSGKLLDRIQPTARLSSATGEAAVDAKRGSDGIALPSRVGPGESLIAEDARYPISERKSGETVTRSVYHPAARFVSDLSERKAVLTLDVVPTAEPGRFRVSLRGAPLAKAKVKVIAASGWEREVQTSESGTFEAAFPWKGAYAIEVGHSDKTPGNRSGQPYDQTYFVTTLTVVQPTGLEPPPPPAAAKPND